MSRPTFQQLTYLVTLADEGHFGRAAERCHVSQPALSSQIRELERRLESTLVERLPKGVHLTSTGIDVVARARLILSGLDELVDAVESGGSAITGSLVVGAIPTVAPYILSDFVTAVRELHPGASLRFVELRTDELLVALRSGQIDLGIQNGTLNSGNLFRQTAAAVIEGNDLGLAFEVGELRFGIVELRLQRGTFPAQGIIILSHCRMDLVMFLEIFIDHL